MTRIFISLILASIYLFLTLSLANIDSDSSSESNENDSDDDFDCNRLPPALFCSCEKIQTKCGTSKLCENYKKSSWNKPVQITLFYEGLCPGCQRFIETNLLKASVSFKNYINIELVPYGNAKRLPDGTIICQHGEDECKINKYESCAIHFMQDPLPFIFCMEKLLAAGTVLEKAARKCYAAIHTIPHIYDQIIHCYNSALGNTLQVKAAERTESAWPDKHEYVPWILINNASLLSQQYMQNNLNTLICQSYVGDEPPSECQLETTTQ
jgi:interferon gamma-inducible protein 30